MPLGGEGLWWADDMTTFTTAVINRSGILPDDYATRLDYKDMFTTAITKVNEKEPPVNIDMVRLETLDEAYAYRPLHVGSLMTRRTLAKIHNEFVPKTD